MQKLEVSSERFVEGFLSSCVEEKRVSGGLMTQLRVQTMLLDPAYKAPRAVPSHRPPRRLSSKKKKELKLHSIPHKEQKYELYLPLHELWVSYIEELLQAVGRGEGKGTNQAQMNQRLLKADFHGSIMKVERSKCPSYVGIEGILLLETQNTLQLICKDNLIRTVPKANSVFTFTVCGFQFRLYGNHMRFRSSERSARKFKDKHTIDL